MLKSLSYMFFSHIPWILCFCFPDNSLSNMFWPGDYTAAVSDGELTCADRTKPDTPAQSVCCDMRTDDQTQEATTALLPGLPNIYTHPHKGKAQSQEVQGI